jgi:hypothetical protein
MTAWLVSWLPGWLTGRAGPRARREVSRWTKNNATLRTFRYGRFRRLLLWSADHPVVFVLWIGAAAAGIAYLAAGQRWGFARHLPGLVIDEKFDPAAYTGVPWSVQATLVALVYPIVLAFVALMLQRRAHSTVALRVYVLDSGVVPAGASSIGLLLALGAQYFATPYSNQRLLAEYMAPLLLLNGTWFAVNLFLTGFFLSRTVRFIQEEEQRHAYTRVAVDVVLRAELTSAVKQHIFVNAPYADWGFSAESADSDNQPQVRMFKWVRGEPVAKRDLKGSLVLHDVHLHLLKWVVRSWCERARQPCQRDSRHAPVISFPPLVGEIATGEVVLCSVDNGPPLTAFERALVQVAFWYRPSRQGTLSLSTKKMLEEIGVEVEAAAEQRRFSAAEDGLRSVIRLHKTLLLASAADSKGAAESAATIGTSPYAFGENSFDIEWLKPYREIGRIAMGHLEEDSRLFRTLAVVPASIAAELPPKPEKLVIDAMLVALNLTYQLGGWWTRKADANIAPGATSFSGTLPAPLSKVYEQALVAFVGSWGHLRIRVPENRAADAVEAWAALTARAFVYAKHVENSAQMFLKAGSRWLLDSFIKWWGNRQHELDCGDPDERQFLHVTLTLADKAWPEVQTLLWDGETPVTIDAASKALSLAIRRYWESMRLYVALLLIHNAGTTPAPDCRELRLAAALIKGTAQQRGGNADCWPLDDVDTVSTAILGAVFGVETVVGRIDGFAEKLRWENEAPEVSGWIYGWSGTPTDLESMKRAQATLLVAVAVPRGRRVGANRMLIERWWRDLDKLESVARYCQDLRRQLLAQDFKSAMAAVNALQTHLGTTSRIRSARFAVSRTLKELQKVALFERVITLRSLGVDGHAVSRMGEKIATLAFDAQHWPSSPVTSVQFVTGLVADQQSVTFEDDKKRFVTGVQQQLDAGLAEHMAEFVRAHALGWSLSKRIADAAIAPANAKSLRHNQQANVAELQVFISSVAALCKGLRSAGIEPVVLVGRTGPSSYLRPHRWGPAHWQCPLPIGVNLRNGDPGKGELATAFVDETPVYEFDTPNGDCYVVPASIVKTLEVGGTGASSALSIKWTQVNDERLRFLVSWKAKFL